MKSFRILPVAVAILLSAHAGAETIVDWNLAGAPGNQASQAGASAAANVTGGSIVRGSGLTASAASNSFSSAGWENAAVAPASTEYFSFGFSVASGYQVDLASLYVGTRSSAQGPGTLGLYYSGDNYVNALFTFSQAGTSGGIGYLNTQIDLSTLPNLTGDVDFRIYEIGNGRADGGGTTSSGGTFRLTGYFVDGSFERNMQFTGTVTAVPEPGTYAMLLAGLGLLGVATRRRDK